MSTRQWDRKRRDGTAEAICEGASGGLPDGFSPVPESLLKHVASLGLAVYESADSEPRWIAKNSVVELASERESAPIKTGDAIKLVRHPAQASCENTQSCLKSVAVTTDAPKPESPAKVSLDQMKSYAEIVNTALNYWGRWLFSRDDARQIAWEALLKCRLSYDDTLGATFKTYALSSIKFSFIRVMSSQRSLVQFKHADAASITAWSRKNCRGGEVDIAAFKERFASMREKPDGYIRCIVAMCTSTDASLDAPVKPGADVSFIDLLPGKQGDDVELESAELSEFKKKLPERWALILDERLVNDDVSGQAHIGERFGVTLQAIQSTEKRVVRDARNLALKSPTILNQLRPSQRQRIYEKFDKDEEGK